jgi:hypothetical protein
MIPTEPTTIHPDLLKDYIEPSLLGFNQIQSKKGVYCDLAPFCFFYFSDFFIFLIFSFFCGLIVDKFVLIVDKFIHLLY